MPSFRRKTLSRLTLRLAPLVLATGLGAATYTWKPVAIHGGGFVPGLAFSPVQAGLLYARTDVGGFYRWEQAQGRWTPLTDMFGGVQANFAGGESIAPDPVDPAVVYAAAGFSGNGVILRSGDQGATWTVNPTSITMGGNDDGRQAGERLAVDPHLTSKLYFGSRSQGLWVSTDSAATWSQVSSFPVQGDAGYGIAWVIFDPAGSAGSPSATVYVGVLAMASGNCNIYRSTNAGASWAVIPGGPSAMITTHASLGSDGRLWAVYDSGGYGPGGITNGQIWRLNTGTLAWSNVTPPNGPPSGYGGYGGISVDAQDPLHAVVVTMDWWSGNDKAFATADGGGTWATIKSSATGWNTGPYSQFSNGGDPWIRGCDTTDSGTMGWPCSIKIDPFNSDRAFFGTGGGVWSSANIRAASPPASVLWTYTSAGIEETVALFLCPATAGGVLFSSMGDVGGMRHTNLDSSPAAGVYCNPLFTNCNMVDYAEADRNKVVRVGNSGSANSDIAYSTDNGQTWSPWGSAPPGYGGPDQMSSIAIAADGSRIVASPFAGKGSPAYASALGGAWTTCAGLPSGAWVAADRVNANTFYATSPSQWVFGGTVTVYRSTDGGASFTAVNSLPINWGDANGNGQFVLPRAVFGVAGEFWISTYSALYRLTNGGATLSTISAVYEPMGGVGFGKAAPSQTHPAVFVSGIVGGIRGLFRNDDGTGATWVRIDDDQHRYGNPAWMEGDQDIYGRVYTAGAGRGLLYGDPIATASPTPTRTATSTPTRSATPTASRTASATTTPSGTQTRSPSASPTASATATPSPTGSRSATPTDSQTASATLTPSATQTRMPSASPSASPAATATGTVTPSASPSGTAAASPTASMTPTTTPAVSASPTGTPGASATPTGTPAASATPTGTQAVSASPTKTPVASASPTGTLAASVSPSPSLTATLSASATGTPAPSASPSPSPSPSATVSGSPSRTTTASATASPTATGSVTASPTPPASPSVTAPPSPTGAPADGECRILEAHFWPNPGPAAAARLSVKLAGRVESLELAFYTDALTVVAKQRVEQALGPGWAGIDLAPEAKALGPGLYFCAVVARRGAQRSPRQVLKWMLLR